MNGITELLTLIGNENINYQMIDNCIVEIKSSKKDKCNHVKFATNEMSPSELITGTGKVGIVVWVSKDELNSAMSKMKEQTK